MSDTSYLWMFFSLVLGIVIVPGMDMAFVLANSLAGGRRGGFFAIGGVIAAGICHVVIGVLGVGIVLQLVPAAFNIMLLLGAAYVAWLGFCLFRNGAALGRVELAEQRTAWTIFSQGALTNLLNPKAYLFMLAVFPQFLKPEAGRIWLQAAILSLIIALTQALVYGCLAVVAGGGRTALAARPHATVLIGRAVGVLLMLVAAVTAFEGWRRP
ncbi:threonine/homoserine/homoserine lactone efflux protein [Bosea sp. BE125]|uniref:LysE family translocator n=1 Tax=Bosea sp. BE125 TaxID=2817909 RepID=UPI0028570E46|nr:LysE family translocator [Bosea sp. BE125]MDR6874140.1 threonine/homoserine/homoserine lactone efflux protein [Bosea sp. BE125]